MLGGVGDRIEAPAQSSRVRIECANDSSLYIVGAVVSDCGPDNEDIAAHSRRRGDLVIVPVTNAQAVCQVDLAVRPEVRAGLAGLRVDSDQSSVQSSREQPMCASRRLSLGVGLFPDRDTSG